MLGLTINLWLAPQRKGHLALQLFHERCKGCCLGGFFHINNTLNVCKTPQQLCSINLLYNQGHTTEVLV